MICPNCGAYNDDGMNFCTSCGSQLPAMSTSSQQNNNQNYYSQNQQNYYQQQPVYYQSPTPVGNPGKGKRIASLVFGIINMYLFVMTILTYGISFIPVPLLSIIGLSLGKSAKKVQTQKSGMTTAGIVLNTICLVISILAILAVIVVLLCVFVFGIALSEY